MSSLRNIIGLVLVLFGALDISFSSVNFAAQEKIFIPFLLAGFFIIGIGTIIINIAGREKGEEEGRKQYENKPVYFESLQMKEPYKVLKVLTLKSYTLLFVGSQDKNKPNITDYAPKDITYLRMYNDELPKDIQEGSIIYRDDKIYVQDNKT